MAQRVHPLSHSGTAWLVNLVTIVLGATLLSGIVAAALRLSI
jgi:hypothetical protein